MPLPDANWVNSGRLLDRAMRCVRLRTVLTGAGAVLICCGLMLVMLPFGPPLANSMIIPKTDPHSGLELLQLLPSSKVRFAGLGLGMIGGLVLLCTKLFINCESQGDGDGNA